MISLWEKFCNFFYKKEVLMIGFDRKQSLYSESEGKIYYFELVVILSDIPSYEWEKEFNKEYSKHFGNYMFNLIKIDKVKLRISQVHIDLVLLQEYIDSLKEVIIKANKEVLKNKSQLNAKKVKETTKNLKF